MLIVFWSIFYFDFSKRVRSFKSWGANQKKSRSADMCRRMRHRQGNSAAESVRVQRVRGSVAEFCPQGEIRGKEFLSRVCGQKWVPPKACHRHANRSVSYRVVAACTESAFLPLYCSSVVRLTRVLREVMARYPDSDGSCIFQGTGMKNCRSVARLQILSGYKENRPARDQRILSVTSGGKMVRCGCGAVVYHSKVICMA